MIEERDTEVERKTTSDLNELMFWIFKHITFNMACSYELKNRVEDKDFRRILFAKQEELLGVLDCAWAEKVKKYHQLVLVDAPFDDFVNFRCEYIAKLREEGLSESEIMQIAYEKYPKNS